jgi:hypothetical protein
VSQSAPTATLAASCALAALRASAGVRGSRGSTRGATRRIPVIPGSGETPLDPDAD